MRRYARVVRLSERPRTWHRQANYPGAFPASRTPLTEHEVAGVLAQRHHIAVRAPEDGLTDRFAFDLDCTGEAEVPRRDRHYRAIRRIMGEHRVPLVYRTPSGFGLRVVYRVPEMPLERVITGPKTGLVAEVLRAAGLPVRSGEIEVYPQRRQADRLPLGKNMPLMDPDTLAPIAEGAIGSRYDEQLLRGGLALLERWHATVYDDLVPHLESLPGEPRVRVVVEERVGGHEHFVRAGSSVRPSVATLHLVHHGLSAPSTRYASEWIVGLAIIMAPELFGLYADSRPDDQAIACALAAWLAERNNGYSREWDASVRRQGTSARAVDAWVERYLERGHATGEHLIDRLRRAVGRLDGSLRRTILLSDAERQEMMTLAEHAGLRGSALYRAEAWLAASRRAVKSIIGYHTKQGTPLEQFEMAGHQYVLAQIASRWMQKWAYGKGVRRGDAAYVKYRQILIDAGWMRLERVSPIAMAYRQGVRPPSDMRFDANLYAVRVPIMDLRVLDVGVDAGQLREALDLLEPKMSGRVVSIDEAHHILWLIRSGQPVRRRYGYRLGTTLQEVADQLESALQDLRGGVRGVNRAVSRGALG